MYNIAQGMAMQVGFKLKHYLLNGFRELFVHHHGSLEFRAKIFALIIAVDEHFQTENFTIVRDLGLQIYNGDQDRANFLLLTTKELVQKVYNENGLTIDSLISSIQHELKMIPRYAKKIELATLRPILALTQDEDTLSYQENILDFLENLKNDTLHTKKDEIDESEKNQNLNIQK
jgi:hypothetical protein